MEHWIANMQEFRRAQRAEGMAALLAIGTATPANVFYQAEYPDYFFRVTNSEHLIELKNKFTRICENSRIHKRHLHLNEDILAANPSIAADWAPSLDARQDILAAAVTKLGKEAADKAIKEWGQPKSRITHLVFCSTTGVHMPGADLQLVKLLGLSCSVRRIMLYNIGCYAGGTVLRVAKDLAENNRGARVLVVCSEVTAVAFRAPSKTNPDDLVGHALFADGAAAIVVGADPDPTAECALFQIVHTHQAFLPGSAEVVTAHLGEVGLMLHLSRELPGLISEKVEECLREAFRPLGMMSDGSVDWNSVFWAAHPGGARILDMIEAKVGLREERLRASRHVLSEYGNMISASVLFLLDEMRKWSAAKGKATTGEGLDWGVLLGFGPGLTVETLVLRSMPIP